MNQKLLHYLLALLLALGTAHLGWAQGATTAAMSGTITDAKGEALPGATVIAVHTPTNTQYVAPTNADGRFNIQNMRVGGPYTVKITFVGYQEYTRTGINLTLAENFRLDTKFSDNSTQLTEVTVTGRQNPVINADRTGAATTIQRQQIERLPTLNRSFADFTRLTPQANGLSFGGRNSGYNNFTVDGAVFNNAFGLSGTVGGQAGAQPISVDALEQIQVSIAPYDVRQGSFTGAGINAVTRSGSNKVTGSVYFFNRNQRQLFLGRYVGNVEVPVTNFFLRNYGARVGGPIVKDKLFFFASYEQERRNDPPTGNFIASTANQPADGVAVSQASAASLDALSSFLQQQYGFAAGPYQNYFQRQNSDKATVKLDWNISANHRFNIKYNYLKSYADVPPSSSGAIGTRSGTAFGLPLQSAYYTINNNLQSVIGELNSTLGKGKFSNNLTAGFSAFRDFRTAFSSQFPFVEIGNGVGLQGVTGTTSANATYTSFGYEPFTVGNLLDTDVYQLGDNFTAYLGKHNVTVGTYNEYYRFRNGFAPNYNSYYRFNSLEDFYSNVGYSYNRGNQALTPLAASAARSNPTLFQVQYGANSDGSFPYAEIQASQLGFYVQDEYSPASNFKVTLGLRADFPKVYSSVGQNTAVAALTFRDGEKINTGLLPDSRLLFSPRIGLNWDVLDNKTLQLRGGTGIFTGRVPFVWISNQASNNGLLFGSQSVSSFTGANAVYNRFNPSTTYYVPGAGGPIAGPATANTSYNLAVTARDFKFPQVWRSNLALDAQLPGGIVGTLEGLYTKDINAIYHQNVNLPGSEGSPVNSSTGSDKRPIFYSLGTAVNGFYPVTVASGTPPALVANNRIYGSVTGGNTVTQPNISDAIVMRNTSLGYSYALTAQLQKTFSSGFFASLAYTYSDSRSVNDGGSIAQSIWRDRAVSGDPNANVLAYSQFLQRHRVIAVGSYRHEYIGHLGTTISLFYTGAPLGRFSYVYSGDMNGDGSGGNNDLVYIPTSRNDIVLRDLTYSDNARNVVFTYTADQQYADLDAYINQDKYLSKHRGQYAERNGAELPWLHQVDMKLIQDIFTNIGENRNTLQLSVDIFNVGNLLNRNWGILRTNQRANLLTFQGYTADMRPAFTFPYLTNPVVGTGTVSQAGAITQQGVALSEAFRDNVTSISSRWQLQVGIRYLFN